MVSVSDIWEIGVGGMEAMSRTSACGRRVVVESGRILVSQSVSHSDTNIEALTESRITILLLWQVCIVTSGGLYERRKHALAVVMT